MSLKPLKTVALMIGLLLGLSACGQRGPLYLPNPPAPMQKPAGYDSPSQQQQPSKQP
ncbi:LPS translocon maturation chaperone LptM [Limnobacter litoralis]|uniref:LPS translocon maturation chaperone LptM n=1 Tax=Limnobacter litoralis TaxID=481366 RepID=UPI0032AF5F14